MKLPATYLVVLAAVAVAMLSAPVALGASPSPAERKALEIRGQGLDRLCGSVRLAGPAYVAVCGTEGVRARMSAAQLQALELRGQAMNHVCVAGRGLSPAAYTSLCGAGIASESGSPGRFGWRDFGMGAAAMLGLLLLGGGAAAGVHYGRRSSVRPRSAS